MSLNMHQHIRESVLKTALVHLLKNGGKSPERTARNIQELLLKFNPDTETVLSYLNLLSLVKSKPWEECLEIILKKLS